MSSADRDLLLSGRITDRFVSVPGTIPDIMRRSPIISKQRVVKLKDKDGTERFTVTMPNGKIINFMILPDGKVIRDNQFSQGFGQTDGDTPSLSTGDRIRAFIAANPRQVAVGAGLAVIVVGGLVVLAVRGRKKKDKEDDKKEEPVSGPGKKQTKSKPTLNAPSKELAAKPKRQKLKVLEI